MMQMLQRRSLINFRLMESTWKIVEVTNFYKTYINLTNQTHSINLHPQLILH